jgi:hypothetical protein
MITGLNKTLHPVPKTMDIEIIPGSIKKLSRIEWFFKWKRKGDNITHHQKVNVTVTENNYFKYQWV